jgi:hypothetical protein
MIVRALRGLFVRPALLAAAVHAPVALVPGRIPLRVVAHGTGVLRAGSQRRFVAGTLDELLFIEATTEAAVVVRFAGLQVVVTLIPVGAPLPVSVAVAVPEPPEPLVAIPTMAIAVPPLAIPLPVLEENR